MRLRTKLPCIILKSKIMKKVSPISLLVIFAMIYVLKMYARKMMKMMKEEEYGSSSCSCGKW